MSETQNHILFDVRLIERNIRQGTITRQDYEKYLSELADREAQADVIDLEQLVEMTHSRPTAG